jgi:hypothetical protein
MQLRERNSAVATKLLKYAFLGVIIKTPQRKFPSQNTPFYNFLLTQPIQTNSNSIDVARQAEYEQS